MLCQVIGRQFSSKTPIHTKICVIGGGTGGLNFVSQILREQGIARHEVRVFEPSKLHYYQPGFTMIGGGFYNPKDTVRKNENLFHKWMNFTNIGVTKIDPKRSVIFTENGEEYSYEHLVIASGIQNDYSQIKGAKEALEDQDIPVGTIYDYNYAQKFNELVQDFGGGKALFTEPNMPIKCAGAPQKIVYLTEERLNKKGIRANTSIEFRKAISIMFSQPKYAAALEQVAASKNINVVKQSNLVEIKGSQRVAVFENSATKVREEVRFDLAHIVPPMKAPEFIKNSGDLGDAAGYVDVNPFTLQHKRYANIWGLGDSANLPTSKTAAAVMAQTPVLVNNLYHVISGQGKIPTDVYDGYTSCPLFVGNKKLMLAEFKYDGVPAETFYSKQEKPSSLFYSLKKDFFPFAYWYLMPYGIWHGRKGVFPAFTKAFTSI